MIADYYKKFSILCLLVSVLCLGGCSAKSDFTLQRSVDNPVFPVNPRNIYLKPFAKNRLQPESLYRLGSVEADYRTKFQQFFQQPGFFGITGERRVNVRGELLSWQKKNLTTMTARVHYEIVMSDGSVLMSETIASEASGCGLWFINPPYCLVRVGRKCFINNLEKLKGKIASRGPEIWADYVGDEKAGPSIASASSASADDFESSGHRKDTISSRVKENIHFGDFYGLIIGNADYKYLPDLKAAINDAEMIAGLLEQKYQFEIRKLINVKRSDILNALTEYRRRLSSNDNLLIYYAGHGWLDKGADEGYWLPVDAQRDAPTNWVSNSTITSFLKAIRAKHVLVIADSCYSGKLARGLKIKDRDFGYFKRLAHKRSRTVMASGGLEEVTDLGGRGNHSVFADALIEQLKQNKGIIDTTLIFENIRRPVILNSDQTPEYSDIRKAGHEGGDFIFVSRN